MAQIDTVQEKTLRIIGTEHPLAIDVDTAYRLVFSKADTLAFREAKLGHSGAVYLITPTPSRLAKGGKINASIQFVGKLGFWRSNIMVSVGKPISIRPRNNNETQLTFTLIHTDEAQYLLRGSANTTPQTLEVLGLSHMPTGSPLLLPASLQLQASTMITAQNKSNEPEQVYLRRIHVP